MLDRRELMKRAGMTALVTGLGASRALALDTVTLPFDNGERQLVRYKQKRPMIGLTSRPPQLETPFSIFNDGPITPNNAFFVRYHLADIPYDLDPDKFTLEIKGKVDKPLKFSLKEIKKLKPVELVAVNQCSGNSRGFFNPRVAGGQLANGAMGNARWRGVPLKAVLDMAGVQPGAKQVTFGGMDGPVSDKTPDFVKSIPLSKAVEDTTLVAYEMNGQPLPHWNGFPARVVVPGWTGTYWMKHVTSITAVTKPFDGFWMKSAYRIPLGKFPILARFPSQETAVNTPITEMVVNSLITSHADGAMVKVGAAVTVGGIAWDGGYGVNSVEVSSDGGKTWTSAALGKDHGPYALRSWSLHFSPKAPGKHVIMARATNKIGQSQATVLIPNPAGYHHNLVQSLTLIAA